MTTTYKFKAAYTKLGVGTAPSVAPVATIVNSANTVLVNAQATTALSNLPGVYLYSYSGTDGLDLIGLFHTDDATVDQQDVYSYTPDILYHVQTLGAGSVSTPITINDGVNPLDGVDVWATTDISGSNVVARGSTDALGLVTFMLDPGTYYIWKTLARYSFTNPSTLVVT